ncbi:molybdopterin biosynthesis protein [Clostridium sp.]|uniref:molybdopterin biosynthesis protein n=1 Tax=Clostridium sp. TaxID=1506 RepID=UPI002FC8BEF8
MALYLNNISLKEAKDLAIKVVDNITLQSEIIKTSEALGRITYKAHFANISSPHFIASAMDGIATCFKYTLEADINTPVTLTKDMYEVVDTGDLINEPFDCVIMKEDIVEDGDNLIIRKSCVPYENIRPIGEDIQMGEMIMPKKQKITPLDISSLLAAKITEVEVFKNITVGIIPTGDEMTNGQDAKVPRKGELVDYNSWTFKALVESYGANAIRYDIVKDNIEDLKKAVILASSECDMVILNAGSSKGRGDFAEDVIKSLGEVLFHGISIKPGKPASLGVVNKCPIFGIPGYPVSAFFVMDTLVKSSINYIKDKIYKTIHHKSTMNAHLARKVVSSLKSDEFVRVKLSKVGEKVVASPIGKGAGVTMSLTCADGYFIVPRNVEGYEASQVVEVNLLRDNLDLESTLISLGSHDVIMDILMDFLKDKGVYLSSTHTGSMGGLLSIRRNEAHMAPIHLLSDTGEYNVDYCKKYIGECVLIKFAKRIQGFITEKGNPLNIKEFKDLERVRYVNRQKGSGTRLLLDHFCEKNNINKSSIKGYDREEITHLTVAAQVSGNSADCGMGILAAAKIMDLDFVPLCSEDYDIVISKDMLEDYRVKCLIETISSSEFKAKIGEIGGYDLSHAGEVIVLGG